MSFFSFKHNKNHPGLPRIIWDSPGSLGLSGIIRDCTKSSSIIRDGSGWSGIIRDGQSNFIKLFDAGLQCEFIRTFFTTISRNLRLHDEMNLYFYWILVARKEKISWVSRNQTFGLEVESWNHLTLTICFPKLKCWLMLRKTEFEMLVKMCRSHTLDGL